MGLGRLDYPSIAERVCQNVGAADGVHGYCINAWEERMTSVGNPKVGEPWSYVTPTSKVKWSGKDDIALWVLAGNPCLHCGAERAYGFEWHCPICLKTCRAECETFVELIKAEGIRLYKE